MNVGTEADVVGEIPSDVVGIFVDHDIVAVPEPVTAVTDVEGSDAEIEAREPKPARAATREMPNVTAAEAPGEVSMLPGMIEVKAGVIPAIVMSDPLTIVVNVRRFGVSLTIPKCGMRVCRARRAVKGRGPVTRNKTATDFAMLGQRGK
jgi:hypothetical protein